MSVTESPTFQNPCIPDGALVIFSFDPVAYAIRLKDETAMEAAGKIARKKYLGIIQGLGPLDFPEMKLNFDILVAGQTPPQEGEDDLYCTSPARSIPISPATAHPEQRAPLVPCNTLPWSEGCYLHTLQLVNAFVSRIHHADAGGSTVLTKEDIARVMHYTTADQYDTPRNRDKDDEGHDEAHEDGLEESEGSYYSSEEGDESESSSVENPFEKPMKVHVEIWEDLSVATTLGEPKNVGAAIDEIVAIGAEWEKRKNYEYHSKAPLTSQWAEGVAHAGEDDPNGAFAGDAPVATHEDDLKPEDAIDERIERAHRGEVVTEELEPEKKAESETPDATPEPAAPASPVDSSALGCASTNKTAGDDGSVRRRGPLQFATAKARHLKEWLRQTLRM